MAGAVIGGVDVALNFLSEAATHLAQNRHVRRHAGRLANYVVARSLRNAAHVGEHYLRSAWKGSSRRRTSTRAPRVGSFTTRDRSFTKRRTNRRVVGKSQDDYDLTPGVISSMARTRRTRGRAGGRRRRVRRRLNKRTGGFLGTELKHYDTSIAAVAIVNSSAMTAAEIDPTGTIKCLTAPAQGASEQNRLGRKITLKSIQINGVIDRTGLIGSAGVIASSAVIQISLILDTQTNGATLNSEDVFHNPGNTGNLCASGLRDMEQIQRFKVLKTWKILLPHSDGFWDGTNIIRDSVHRRFHCYKKLNIPVTFKLSATEGVAQVVDNSLHMIAYKSDPVNPVLIEYNCRVRFVG